MTKSKLLLAIALTTAGSLTISGCNSNGRTVDLSDMEKDADIGEPAPEQEPAPEEEEDPSDNTYSAQTMGLPSETEPRSGMRVADLGNGVVATAIPEGMSLDERTGAVLVGDTASASGSVSAASIDPQSWITLDAAPATMAQDFSGQGELLVGVDNGEVHISQDLGETWTTMNSDVFVAAEAVSADKILISRQFQNQQGGEIYVWENGSITNVVTTEYLVRDFQVDDSGALAVISQEWTPTQGEPAETRIRISTAPDGAADNLTTVFESAYNATQSDLMGQPVEVGISGEALYADIGGDSNPNKVSLDGGETWSENTGYEPIIDEVDNPVALFAEDSFVFAMTYVDEFATDLMSINVGEPNIYVDTLDISPDGSPQYIHASVNGNPVFTGGFGTRDDIDSKAVWEDWFAAVGKPVDYNNLQFVASEAPTPGMGVTIPIDMPDDERFAFFPASEIDGGTDGEREMTGDVDVDLPDLTLQTGDTAKYNPLKEVSTVGSISRWNTPLTWDRLNTVNGTADIGFFGDNSPMPNLAQAQTVKLKKIEDSVSEMSMGSLTDADSVRVFFSGSSNDLNLLNLPSLETGDILGPDTDSSTIQEIRAPKLTGLIHLSGIDGHITLDAGSVSTLSIDNQASGIPVIDAGTDLSSATDLNIGGDAAIGFAHTESANAMAEFPQVPANGTSFIIELDYASGDTSGQTPLTDFSGFFLTEGAGITFENADTRMANAITSTKGLDSLTVVDDSARIDLSMFANLDDLSFLDFSGQPMVDLHDDVLQRSLDDAGFGQIPASTDMCPGLEDYYTNNQGKSNDICE